MTGFDVRTAAQGMELSRWQINARRFDSVLARSVLRVVIPLNVNRFKGTALISRILTALCLLLMSCIAVARGHDPLVYLETWGTPWEKGFEVSIQEDALLKVVVKQDGKSSTVQVKLSSPDAAMLYELAKKAVAENRMTNCEKVSDGTSGRLTVKIGTRFVSRECLHTGRWPPSGTVGAELLRAINAKLPEQIQVF